MLVRPENVRHAFLIVLGLAGCWQAPPTHPRAVTTAAPPGPTLAREAHPPGRLVFDREGRAWEATCSGEQLAVRPWEGGAFQPAGPCTTRDGIHEYSGYDYYTEHVFLDARGGVADRVGVISDRTITIRERGTIARTIALPDRISVSAIAFDGDAIVLVIDRGDPQRPASLAGVSLERSLAALVRIERSGRATMRSLVDYMSTGPGFAPDLVVAGRDHLLLVGAAGGVRTCRYDLTCTAPSSRAPRVYRGLPLADGGALLYEHERHVSLLRADGTIAWTTEGLVWGVFGATDREVWVAELLDDRWRFLDVVALDRATGERLGSRAKLTRSRYDRLGNYLAIAGIAPTPFGPVVRGVFGGLLASGDARLVTRTRGALCWWENPHDGDQYRIPLDGTCRARYAKAILTERAAFVATHARWFRQRRIEPSDTELER
ncbi:MAG: hypothetical protein AB7T06_32600 [Kofleriaceae bacterium]